MDAILSSSIKQLTSQLVFPFLTVSPCLNMLSYDFLLGKNDFLYGQIIYYWFSPPDQCFFSPDVYGSSGHLERGQAKIKVDYLL